MTMNPRRRLLAAAAATAAASTLLLTLPVLAQSTPGVSATEIRIGSTTAFSGPISALGTIQKTQSAFFKMLNEQGGIAGRKINYIVYDDGFSPPKTLEQTRKLLEQDDVAFLFSQLGTGPNSAIVKYVNSEGVPHLFLSVNGSKWADHKTYPWTIPFAPSARTEAQVFVKHALAQNPKAKIGLLYQNDDLGRDYVAGAKDVLGERYDAVVKAVSYEVADPTIDSQLIQLQGTGADVLISGVAGKFGPMVIRRVSELGWKPLHFISNGVASITSTIVPAGPERAVGVIATAYLKDPTDAVWADDAGVKAYKAFMARYYPEGNADDALNNYAYTVSLVIKRVLEQCNGNFSRQNIMLQANSLKDLVLPTLLPGIKVNSSPTSHQPIRQMQLQRWDGKAWARFGNIIEGANY